MSALLKANCARPLQQWSVGLSTVNQRVRPIHTSAANRDFMSWFKRKKQEEHKEPVKDTKQLIKDIEEGKAEVFSPSSSKSKNKLELIPENFIGEGSRRYRRKKELEHAVSSAPFNQWLTRGKVTFQSDLDNVISQATQKTLGKDDQDAQFPDLVTKFQFTKFLQTESGYLIPDYKLTTLSTPLQFKMYFQKEILPSINDPKLVFKESEPDAIHPFSDKYASPNIYVVNDITPKEQKIKYDTIMREIQKLEDEATKKALEMARST
ncbi:mrpl13p [Saccharomyces arboricola H-6]|uniref:Large ribosomal subunit protein mL50 n=1 Tax=Saccharomyces arboricola (strain H-6 / AS 2.3317 / CBS 10644) TaxID=1160507 RepID=J8PLB6_SACAR|nr:mrpl13p [Saccharomyces arboricola H-6]